MNDDDKDNDRALRRNFRLSVADLTLIESLRKRHGLSNRSEYVRFLVYRDARAEGIFSVPANAELPKGRPNKDLGPEKKSRKNTKRG